MTSLSCGHDCIDDELPRREEEDGERKKHKIKVDVMEQEGNVPSDIINNDIREKSASSDASESEEEGSSSDSDSEDDLTLSQQLEVRGKVTWNRRWL